MKHLCCVVGQVKHSGNDADRRNYEWCDESCVETVRRFGKILSSVLILKGLSHGF